MCDNWRITFNARQKDLASSADKNIVNIFNKWSQFKTPQGFELIEIDYKSLKLSEKELDLEIWLKFFKIVRQYTDEIKQNDNTAWDYIDVVDAQNGSSEGKYNIL